MRHPRTRADRRAALALSKARAVAVFARLGLSADQALRAAETPRRCSCAMCRPGRAGVPHPRDLRAPALEFTAY